MTFEIKNNLEQVRSEIETACLRSGRIPASVRLVGVTKTKPAGIVREAYECGLRDFGENYAQEMLSKQRELADLPDINWHFIGALQSNKVKSLAGGVHLIHSVDRESLVSEINRRFVGGKCGILIEVNAGNEETKSGVQSDEVEAFFGKITALENIVVAGLMCIPPFSADPEYSRKFYRLLRETRDRLEDRFGRSLPELSMGMSHDFAVAIEEGATIVRVGTAIFGSRSKPLQGRI